MHELGLATQIADIVEQNLNKQKIKSQVTRINLAIGEMRQVIPDTLQFCFENIDKAAFLEGAELVIEHIPVSGICKKCGKKAEFSEPPFVCRHCGSTKMEIAHGFELNVVSVDVED